MGLVPPFLGPGFRLGARWNRLVETVKTRKRRGKTGKKWARYGLRSVNKERTVGITCRVADDGHGHVRRLRRFDRLVDHRRVRRLVDVAIQNILLKIRPKYRKICRKYAKTRPNSPRVQSEFRTSRGCMSRSGRGPKRPAPLRRSAPPAAALSKYPSNMPKYCKISVRFP